MRAQTQATRYQSDRGWLIGHALLRISKDLRSYESKSQDQVTLYAFFTLLFISPHSLHLNAVASLRIASDHLRSSPSKHPPPSLLLTIRLIMAIHPDARVERVPASALTPQDISAWTEQAVASLEILDISESVARVEVVDSHSPSHALSIPLDEPVSAAGTAKPSPSRVRVIPSKVSETQGLAGSTAAYRRREPSRRDSQKRREALLKGKEGSRRRQRWENGTFALLPIRISH